MQHKDNVDVLVQDVHRLTLITCYPFDALVPGGDERYVIEAQPVVM
nr:hypothetical protein [Solemya velesiana gill symbiont]